MIRRSFLVGVMTASLVTVVLTYPEPTEPREPTEAEIVSQLPKEVRVLLKGGLCDSIHEVFLQDVQRLPAVPYDKRQSVQERISYYREWLRRKGCG